MKKNKYIRLLFFCLAVSFTAILSGCSDDDDPDYTDDSAYPPPVINLTTQSIQEAAFNSVQTVSGSISATNGLRDIYGTLVKKTAEEYEEISPNARVYSKLDGFPKSSDFSFDISVNSEDAAAIQIVATDIFTKQKIETIIIERLTGILPKISAEPQEIASVALDEIVTITGKATSADGIQSIAYNLIQKSPYLELQAEQTITVSGTPMERDFQFDVKVNDERAEAIRIIATDAKGVSGSLMIDIKTITGIPEGKASVFEEIEMAPEWESPLDPQQPYIFSAEGVNVGGTIKNVLTLRDAFSVNEGNIDFMFTNVWRNQDNLQLLANRGFAFVGAERIFGGPIGRQRDADWLASMTRNLVYFRLISSDLVSSMDLDTFFETTTGNWETYEALNQLENYVSSNANDKMLLQRLNASSNNTTDCSLQIVDGTYIAFKRQNSEGVYKYGIIQVIEAADDSEGLVDGCKIGGVTTGNGLNAHYTGPNLPGFDYTGVTNLYGKKCKLKIIVQK